MGKGAPHETRPAHVKHKAMAKVLQEHVIVLSTCLRVYASVIRTPPCKRRRDLRQLSEGLATQQALIRCYPSSRRDMLVHVLVLILQLYPACQKLRDHFLDPIELLLHCGVLGLLLRLRSLLLGCAAKTRAYQAL